MDHDKTPVLEAIDQYRRSGDDTFHEAVPTAAIQAGADPPDVCRGCSLYRHTF